VVETQAKKEDKADKKYLSSGAKTLFMAALLSGVSLGSMVNTTVVAADDTAKEGEKAAPGELDEILVFGRKRLEKVFDVPSSVSVIGAEDFKQAGGRNLRDLELKLANIHFTNTQSLVNNIITIRGIGTDTRSAGLETGTAYYLDGVLLNRPGLFAVTTNDIGSIEVFRGPQGTEFGRNALAGVFYSTTAKPDGEWGYEGMLGFGNYKFWETSHMLTGPITDKLSFRTSIQHQKRVNGYLENIAGPDAGRTEPLSARINLTYQASENTKIELIGNYAKDKIDLTTLEWFLRPELADNASLFFRQLACTFPGEASIDFGPPFGVFSAPCLVAPGPLTIAEANPARQSTESFGIQANIDHTFDSGWAIRSINAYYDNDTSFPFDLGSSSEGGTPSNFVDNAWQFSSELQLISPLGSADGKPWDFVSGVFYFHEELLSDRFTNFGPPGIPIGDENGFPTGEFTEVLTQLGTQTLNSYAAYLNANYYVNDKITLNAGVRLSHESRDARQEQTGSIQFFIGRVTERDFELEETKVTGTLSAQYKFSDTARSYVKWARGFKPGGVNLDSTSDPSGETIPVTFDAEISDLFELGLRTRFDDNRGSLNVTGFYQLYKNQQNTILFPGNPAIPSVPGQIFNAGSVDGNIIFNIGDARSYGLETELTYQPIDELFLRVVYGYTNAKYNDDPNLATEFDPAANAILNQRLQAFAGTDLPFSRNHTISGSITYTKDFEDVGSLSISPSVSWQSPQNSNSPGIRADRNFSVDATITFRDDDERFQFEIWGRNLTNELYLLSVFGNSFTNGIAGGTYNVPRTYGARLRVFWD